MKNLYRGLSVDDWELYSLNLELGWLRTIFAQSGNEGDWELYSLNLEWDDWELYSLNVEIWKPTKNCICSIWNGMIENYSLNVEIWKPIENYICSILTLGWLRTIFARSGIGRLRIVFAQSWLLDDRELYSLKLVRY